MTDHWPVGQRAGALALVLVLTVLLAVWGAFLVPLRVFGVAVPVSWIIALVGNFLLGWAGARLAGALGAALPALVWIVLVLVLASPRTEGDIVVRGTTIGTGFLVAGALGSAVAFGARPRDRSRG